MRKSRGIAVILLIFIGPLSFPTNSFAAAKAGSACKVVGQSVNQNGQNLICTKNGKKITWVAKVENKIAQTALGSPIAMNAYAELQKRIAVMQNSPSPNIRTIPTPSTSAKLENEIQKNLIFASEYFGDHLPSKYPITAWVIGSPTDLKWYSASWRVAIPLQAENLISRQDGFSAEVGMATDGAFAIVITSPDQLTSFHEFTHAVQDYVANGKAGLPCWVREGMAEYESNAMMGRNSETAYKTAMLNLIDELSMINFSQFKYRSAGLDYWVNFFANDESRNNGECRLKSSLLDPAYSVGGLGFQYLFGQYGRDKVYEFVENIGKDWKGVCASPNEKMIPCKSWKTSFKKAFGVEPATAYKSMGAFIVNQIEWSRTAKSLSESAIQSEFPESRRIPDYPPLPNRDAAGAPCSTKDQTSGDLKCVVKDSFLFWGAINNPGNQPATGTQQQPMVDDLGAPPGVPAPGRTCPNIGDKARYEKTPLVCVKNGANGGLWMIDPNPPS
jgi:hypothetical protein